MLVPSSTSAFCISRFITHGDVIWGPSGAHIVTKCAKNMQMSGQVQVVQLPELQDKVLCHVTAFRSIVARNPQHADKPLFTIRTSGSVHILTACTAKRVLRRLVMSLDLLPVEFGTQSGGRGLAGLLIIM